MRKLRKAAVAVAICGHGGGCRSHDLNLDVLGEVGILNGPAGNLINGEGGPGAQITDMGSDCGLGR